MRLFFAIIIIALNSALGISQVAEFSIEEPVYKFPKTYEGVILQHEFKFTNTGDAPLIISDYTVSCSCTKAILPKEPILPGKSSVIKVTFDTNGKYYHQDRIIYIKTNAKKSEHKLRFKVNVIPKNE